MKKMKCRLCLGKGYLEIRWKDYFLFITKELPKPYERVHCPQCYGMKWEWSLK